MPQTQRMRVFKGELAKTSGGLRKADLVRNKRGKIVSKKKSSHAHGNENNLGSWLRGKGDKFGGKPKGLKEGLPAPKVAKAKPKAAPKKAAPKPKPAPKKKKLSSKATVVSLPKPSSRPKKTKTEPLQAGEKKDLSAAMPEKADELRKMLHAWRAKVDAKMMKPNPAYKQK